MGEIHTLFEKTVRTLKNDGVQTAVRKAGRYMAGRRGNQKQHGAPEHTFADVLFINGCYLPHPPRYRVTHQREQLWAADVSSNEVFYTDLSMKMAGMYRVFIFFRCPYTELIGAFIRRAKSYHKVVLYDIDDLMFDRAYTSTIRYIQHMTDGERADYYAGIDACRKTLQLCDAAVASTERLAQELKKYVPHVYINRNTASEEMLKLSEAALEHKKDAEDGIIRLGYFSGSITHNADVQMILPVMVKLLKKYPNLRLLLMGDLDCPAQLQEYADQVECMPFADWRKLPEKIALADINLAPLENSIFNEAKSENKWVEAALVKVPTAASNVGAFAQMITDGVTGMLCDTPEDWEHALERLIEDAGLRRKIGNSAYAYCRKNCTSIYTALPFAEYIRSIRTPNIAFILPVLQISGGALVVLKHCAMLKEAGYDVTIINQGDEADTSVSRDGQEIPVVNYWQVSISAYLDKAAATLWSTVRLLEEYARIGRRYYNVQNFETDFYPAGRPFRIDANRTYCTKLDMHYITISKWCRRWLRDTYGKDADYAPNGIDTARFYPVQRCWTDRKIRILIEGNSDDYYKNVDESFRITALLDKSRFEIWFMSYQGKPKEWYETDCFLHKVPYEDVPDVYRACDILIKSSILESFSYPPLEMMATGGYVVAAPNDGNREYLEDGENCLFYAHDDLHTAVQAVERIVGDQVLRDRLYQKGIQTAEGREWENIRSEILQLYGAVPEPGDCGQQNVK